MNPMLGQILSGVFGQAMRQREPGGAGGGLGGGLGGAAMGSVLGGMLGGRGRAGGGRNALLLMMLPLAMRWIEANGGIGAVLKRFQDRGYGRQAQSWLATGDNEALDEDGVEQVVGGDELAQMAQQLGVPQQEVAQAFAEIMPQMVDQLSPQGELPQAADDVLADGRSQLEREMQLPPGGYLS